MKRKMKYFFFKYELFAIAMACSLLVIIGLLTNNLPTEFNFLLGFLCGWGIRLYWKNTFPTDDDYEDDRNYIDVGSIVKYNKESGGILACGEAICISMKPFIITSRDSDMRWKSTIKINDFIHVGLIDKKTLKNCKRRLLN